MNSETTLFRQVRPGFIPDGQLTSQAFMPFPKDEGRLSVYDGDQISAADSYKHYTEMMGYLSHSVWGVTCTEVTASGLTTVPDAKENFPSHSVIDFTSHPEKGFRKLAKRLKVLASARGCLYGPE